MFTAATGNSDNYTTVTNNLGVGLGTNWVNVPASMQTNQMTVPLNAANGSAFFRLVRP